MLTCGLVLATNPPPTNVPDGEPQPGEKGGGGPPNNDPGNILSLVPAGLVAVSTFPPFETVRENHDAVAAVFKSSDLSPAKSSGSDSAGLNILILWYFFN